jgi:hypothetical protein
MKAAAYRFASPEIMKELFDSVISEGGLNLKDYLLHPVFYLRISKPNLTNNALLDSQPHYDRSFGIYSYSFWLALEDASIESGGLCFFHDSVEDIFKIDWNSPNKYNYDKYLEDHKNIDSKISNKIIYPNIKAGSAYKFDSNILHAATKSLSEVRLSFDFRIVEKNKLIDADDRTKKIFYSFNDNIALSNAKNLKLLGDEIGMNRLISKYELNPLDFSFLTPKTDILIPKNKLSWRTEYSWIDL